MASSSERIVVPDIDPIERAIQKSHVILELRDDWDGEGSPGYARGTLNRANDFLRRHAIWVREHYGIVVQAPDVTPGPDGSIDIHWQTDGRELLVNVPVDAGKPATFYGDDRAQNVVKGSINTAAHNEWLLLWLAS